MTRESSTLEFLASLWLSSPASSWPSTPGSKLKLHYIPSYWLFSSTTVKGGLVNAIKAPIILTCRGANQDCPRLPQLSIWACPYGPSSDHLRPLWASQTFFFPASWTCFQVTEIHSDMIINQSINQNAANSFSILFSIQCIFTRMVTINICFQNLS